MMITLLKYMYDSFYENSNKILINYVHTSIYIRGHSSFFSVIV